MCPPNHTDLRGKQGWILWNPGVGRGHAAVTRIRGDDTLMCMVT